MQGWARSDYPYFGGKTPLQRHLEHARSKQKKKQWLLVEAVTEKDIEELAGKTRAEIEYYIHGHFLEGHELSVVIKARNRGKKRGDKAEYYDFLEQFKNGDCIPAMQDVIEKGFATMRAALLQRLREQGIEVVPETPL